MNINNHIIQPSIGKAWVEAMEMVIANGVYIKDGNVSLKELLNLTITITQPDADFLNDTILQKFATPDMITTMRENFFTDSPFKNWGYSYAQRIENYDGINQYESIVQKLKENPETKSATIVLNKPKDDALHIPCINILDFKLRNNTLILNAFFRSQDIAKKLFADAVCLSEIAQKTSEALGVKNKELNIYVMSAHIYEPDKNDAERIIKNAAYK